MNVAVALPTEDPVQADGGASAISLSAFIEEFGDGLLEQVRSQNPPIYTGVRHPGWDAILDGLKRKRTAGTPQQPRKKPSKGPKTNIEYEYVREPTQRQMEVAK